LLVGCLLLPCKTESKPPSDQSQHLGSLRLRCCPDGLRAPGRGWCGRRGGTGSGGASGKSPVIKGSIGSRGLPTPNAEAGLRYEPRRATAKRPAGWGAEAGTKGDILLFASLV